MRAFILCKTFIFQIIICVSIKAGYFDVKQMLNGYFPWTSSNCRKHVTIKINLENILYSFPQIYNSDEFCT